MTNQNNRVRLTPDKIALKIDKKLENIDAGDLVDWARDVGEKLYNNRVKTNQIRKFLSALISIKMKIRSKKLPESQIEAVVIMLKPKLAYAVSRQRNKLWPLMTVLEPAINNVKNAKDFENLAAFVEAIVAYHKYLGGE